MVSCLFARGVYTPDLLAECLTALGYRALADNLGALGAGLQKKRWHIRMATGFKPDQVRIPKRFLAVTTWKGPTDAQYLGDLMAAYAHAVEALGREQTP
jgi:aldehyde:ferredoxin oxidoreductase